MTIHKQVRNGVMRATIDRPEALNAFDIPTFEC
jgi:enoyl-CoA hydratase/carnithine racemase